MTRPFGLLFNYRAPQRPLSAVPRGGWCASGRRERTSTLAAPLVAPLETRHRGAPASPPYYTERGREGWSSAIARARTRDDRVLAIATPPTPAPFRDTRRRRASKMRMRCARRVCSVVVLAVQAARRVERASQRRLSDVAAQWQRRSTRALTMFSAGNRRRRARGGEQGPAEVVYLCRLPIWGQPLARQRPCRPSVAPG